mgnify:CR=1 FL=1|jgi:hypothetical protein
MSQQMIDWTKGDQPSTAVVAAVAEVTDRDIRELSPLQSTLDVDALDTLIIRGVANSDADVQVSFRYEGFQVSVETDGSITLMND